jgi:spondin N
MMPRSGVFPPFLLLALVGCGGSSLVAPTTAPMPAPTANAAAVARYRVTFDASWSAQSHPNETPRTPHFSRLIGGTHRATVQFWEAGGQASEGIRLMAEQGRTTPLDTEVEAAIATGHAQRVLVGDGIDRSPDRVSLDFEISRDFSQVTLVSMLAPSPDWFVGVSGLSLIENGDWVAERVVVLQPWDAGTDSGHTFSAADVKTSPPEPIHLIASGPLVVGASVPPVGTFTFRRIS